jgi:hypothetical protein
MSRTVLFLVLAIVVTFVFAVEAVNPFAGESHPVAALLLCIAIWAGWMISVLDDRAVERLTFEKDQIDNLIKICESTLPRNKHCKLTALSESELDNAVEVR